MAPVEPSFGEDDILEEGPDVDDAGEGAPCTPQVDGTSAGDVAVDERVSGGGVAHRSLLRGQGAAVGVGDGVQVAVLDSYTILEITLNFFMESFNKLENMAIEIGSRHQKST